MRPRTVVAGGAGAVALLLTALPGVPGVLAGAFEDDFPHLRHEGLFPTCTGCHRGVPTGDEARFYPGESACTGCHDGEERDRVEAPAPDRRPTNLVFSHPAHARNTGGELDCVACHGAAGAESRMDVQRASPGACLGCHAHQAPSHLAEGRECTACHRPLVEAEALTGARIAGFPMPPAHDRADFVLDHDPGAATDRCATCHARESCTRCHLNGNELAPIRALEPDPRVAEVVASRPPSYPRPDSHREEGWRWTHGDLTRRGGEGGASCGNCHTRASCTSCHGESGLQAVAVLPTLPADDPRGVRIEEAGLLHPPAYALDHGAAAASDGSCASCHRPDFCESCHAGADTPPFHLPNFLERHGPDAYAASTDCASCHDTEVFCRSCHEGVGLGDRRRLGVTAHTSRPFWLVGHGQAARQGLAGCITCHDQGDCATCHSASFGWRVNPHGPGFDPEGARDANPFACARCHRGGGFP